eukprot:942455-Pyramimonas_sp.AAC.1
MREDESQEIDEIWAVNDAVSALLDFVETETMAEIWQSQVEDYVPLLVSGIIQRVIDAAEEASSSALAEPEIAESMLAEACETVASSPVSWDAAGHDMGEKVRAASRRESEPNETEKPESCLVSAKDLEAEAEEIVCNLLDTLISEIEDPEAEAKAAEIACKYLDELTAEAIFAVTGESVAEWRE